MEDEQKAELEAGQRVMAFNADNSAALDAIGADDDTVAPTVAGVIAQVGAVELAESKQQHDAGDTAVEKERLKQVMGTTVEKFALRGEVKALYLEMDELAASLHHPKTYMTDEEPVLAVSRANDIKGILDLNKGPLGVLTNIVVGNIDEMKDAIKAFKDYANKPTEVIKEKKAEGTDKIQPELDKLNDFVEKERKLLHSYWNNDANKAKLDAFDLLSHVVVLGRGHNVVKVTLQDDLGEPLLGALLTSLSNNKTSNGNRTNIYVISGIRVGLKSFKAEKTGWRTAEFDMRVKRGTTVEITLKMVRV